MCRMRPGTGGRLGPQPPPGLAVQCQAPSWEGPVRGFQLFDNVGSYETDEVSRTLKEIFPTWNSVSSHTITGARGPRKTRTRWASFRSRGTWTFSHTQQHACFTQMS